MPLRYLLDENLRGNLWGVVQRHNSRGINRIDVVRVGDDPALPLGLDDEAILSWCEHEQRILVTFDKETMPGHLAKHLAAGNHSPGIFTLRDTAEFVTILEFLIIATYASTADEWHDAIRYIP